MAKDKVKPGQPAPASGLYEVVGPRGGNHGEVTAVWGHTMPPTRKPGQAFVLVDPAKNGAGRPKK